METFSEKLSWKTVNKVLKAPVQLRSSLNGLDGRTRCSAPVQLPQATWRVG